MKLNRPLPSSNRPVAALLAALTALAGLANGADKKILFLAGSDSHGWGAHAHGGGTRILSNAMKESGMPVEIRMIREWPGEELLMQQDAFVIYADGWWAHPANGHVEELKRFMDGGGGLTVIHWATGLGNPEINDKTKDHSIDPVRRQWRNLVGADFEPWHSCSRFWDASFTKLPEHPVTRGVPPFTIHDECYFHLRCEDPEHAHVTPLHRALPPLNVINPGAAADSGSVSTVEAVKRGEEQYCAWGFERPEGGRTFGFTGGHTHWNWGRDELRKLILNGVYWCAGGEVPVEGIGSKRPNAEEMLEGLEGNPGWTAEALQIALDRAGSGELIRWGQFNGGALPFGPPPAPKVNKDPGKFFEGEELKVVAKTGAPGAQDMAGFGAGVWSGNSQLWWTGGKPGDLLELEFAVLEAGNYEVHLGATKARDYGILSFSLNGEPLTAGPVDFFQPSGVSHTGDLQVGKVDLKAGPARLAVKIEGANKDADKAYMFGLDWIHLVKAGEKQSLFDGKSLKGWQGTGKWWRVEDGALTGEIPAGEKLGNNEFLWWDGEVHDFELRVKCRISGDPTANSGVQFRAERGEDGHAAGYQADLDDGAQWFGRIYDEHGRGLLLERGAKVEINEAGQRTATGFREPGSYLEFVKKDDWNDYVIRAVGPRMQTWINGTLAGELIDNQLGQHDYSGRVALQLHSGPGPARVAFKEIELIDLGKTEPPQSLAASQRGRQGVSPKGMNLGFEEGTLRGWKVEGEVWKDAPVKGDTVSPRRPGQASNHHGEFWVGGYERTRNDLAQGMLTSEPFEVTAPWASFLVGGGPEESTRVEIVAAADGKVLFAATGKQVEDMSPVTVDLSAHVGESIRVRVVDASSRPWGHINYDDFRFHAEKPTHKADLQPSRVAVNPILQHLVANPGEHENQTVASMSVPGGFRVDLLADEPEITQPVALSIDERGRLWVVEAHSYPRRQPEGQGKDRVVIFEDADGNGSFEKRTIFATGLNLVSGIEVGFGGVWIGAAPQLLFIPDKDRDDVPDGDPVVLLDGWGLQDTHETLNSFIWGPDGWLYGNQGVFCHSRIGKPGTPDAERTEMRAGVWRYHPTRHEFEVFSNGCSNQWGIDFNERGHMFLTHCRSAWGGGPTTYVVKNGHYWNQSNSNHAPFVASGMAGWNPGDEPEFRNFLPSSARYDHGEGGAGKPGSGALYGGHSHVGTMIYLGGNWPEQYRDQLFTHNLHGRQMNRQINNRLRSGYETVHAGTDQMHVEDERFMGIGLKYGPDGAVCMIDWQDKQHCHTMNEVWDRSDGGMYRMAWTETWKPVRVDLGKATAAELVAMVFDRNEWFSRTARRVLQERGDHAAAPLLQEALGELNDVPKVLRAMWALHGLGATLPDRLLVHEDEAVRSWAVRLTMECGTLAPSQFHVLCESDPSALVRSSLASELPRLKPGDRWQAAELLAAHREDQGDTYVPKQIWFGIAPLALDDPERIVAMAEATNLEVLADSIVWYVGRDQAGRDALVTYLLDAPEARVVRGLNLLASSFPSAAKLPAPEGWATLVAQCRNGETAAAFDRLGAVFGDEGIAVRMEKMLGDRAAPPATRREAFQFLAGQSGRDSSRVFLGLLGEDDFRAEVIPLLGRYNNETVAAALLRLLPELAGKERLDALNALCAQPLLAKAHLRAIATNRGGKNGMTSLHLRQMRNLGDKEVDSVIDELWGRGVESGADVKASIDKYRALAAAHAAAPMNREAGQEAFAKVCASCHALNGAGGRIGPDLTGSWRNGIDYFLESIVDPNAVIGENFQLNIVTKNDGGVVSGMPAGETPEVLTIQTLTEAIEIPVAEIKSRQILEQSMMPPALLDTLPEAEVVALLKYLTTE